MLPDLKEFSDAAMKVGGNKSKIADYFKVTRRTVDNWIHADKGFEEAIDIARGRRVDALEDNAYFLAMGVAERDSNGKFVRWIERPDPSMIRFLLQTRGKGEGFGENLDITTNGKDINNTLFRKVTKEDIENFKEGFDKEY